MSRLYIVLLLLLSFSFDGLTQKKLKQIIEFADEQYDNGDYYYALSYYKKALEKDSNSIKLLWKYAETLRAYKDYPNAETYYAKVYAREQTKIYPNSLLNLALMQKQNGRYTKAIKTLKLSEKKLDKRRNSPYFIKTIREIESCKWAKDNLMDSALFTPLFHLPETVNTYDAEFGHTIKDNVLIFSALKADSSNSEEEVYDPAYRTKLYYSKMDSLGVFENANINKDLFHKDLSYGNGTYSLDGNRYYFSLCENDGFRYSCNIVVAQLKDSVWTITDTLGAEINTKESNSTMPYFTKINGNESMIFSSDRKGGKGGLDLWYAQSIDGIEFKSAINISTLNSPENEVTPFYDTLNKKLYFSSTWHNGFGGQDIHFSTLVGGVFSSPENAGNPLNSSANDLYYFNHHDSVYISSNRLGSIYSKNPTCCSDIYAAYPKIELLVTEEMEDTILLEERIEQMLPVTLYFRNDEPDASTMRTTTKQSYKETYRKYVSNYDYYRNEVAKGISLKLASSYIGDLNDFFSKKVDFGALMLDSLNKILIEELKAGSKIEVSIKGYASPVAKTAYNINLTKRRISSLVNYFKTIDNGVFRPYLDAENTKLSFVQLPFGEYSADQNISDDAIVQNESVFSRAAGMERRIQVEHISINRDKSVFPIHSEILVQNLKNNKSGSIITSSFTITNESSEKIKLILPEQSPLQKTSTNSNYLLPNQSQIVDFLYDTKGLIGHQSFPFELTIEGYKGQMIFYTNIELE